MNFTTSEYWSLWEESGVELESVKSQKKKTPKLSSLDEILLLAKVEKIKKTSSWEKEG